MEVSKKVAFIKDWILNYVNSMPKKAQSLVIGISGGIDSSVTSTLCAMTGCKTIVITMPIHQNPDETNRGKEHCIWLSEKFNEQLRFVIAGYNAGPGSINHWIKSDSKIDTKEFLDMIPYPETKAYLERVVNSYMIYNAIY